MTRPPASSAWPLQSHWFSVGPLVPWARPGVGAVATQANVEVAYGPRALDAAGARRQTPPPHWPGCSPRTRAPPAGRWPWSTPAGASRRTPVRAASRSPAHITGEGVSCQANIMASARVWPAMLGLRRRRIGCAGRAPARRARCGRGRGRRYPRTPVGGDPRRARARARRGRRRCSLRVEDHPRAARRARAAASRSHGAYALADRGDELAAGGPSRGGRGAVPARERARPGNPTSCASGPGSAPPSRATWTPRSGHVRAAIEVQPGWRELLRRLIPREVAPDRAGGA